VVNLLTGGGDLGQALVEHSIIARDADPNVA
jgi:hypothetical protein